MAVFDNTALSATIDEKWSQKVYEARYAKSVVLPLVLNESDKVANSGDIVNLTYKSKYSAGTVTSATGAFTPQQITLTPVQITMNQWMQCAIEVLDQAKFQSFYEPDSDFPDDAGQAFSEDLDTKILSLYSGLTTNTPVGSSTDASVFDEVSASIALLQLADRNIPKDELRFILPPCSYYNGILRKPAFTDASSLGTDKSLLTTGAMVPVIGTPAYMSTLCPTEGSARVGVLIHKTAFAVAMNKKTQFDRAKATAAGKLSLIVVGQSLYGVKTFRADHGVIIYVRP